MGVRNHFVYIARKRAIDVVLAFNQAQIHNRLPARLDYGEVVNYRTYDRMTFMFSKWTFEQFYPALSGLEAMYNTEKEE